MANKRKIGESGETLAAKLLKMNGYDILEMNFRTRSGEIDIIAREGGYLVFIEVKARRTTGSGYPEEAVTPSKQKKITQTALFYMAKNRIPDGSPVRFDVLLILGDKYRIIKNAFDFN